MKHFLPNLEATGSSSVVFTTLLTLIPRHIMSSKDCSNLFEIQKIDISIFNILECLVYL